MINELILPQIPPTWYETINKTYGKPCVAITFQVTEDCCMACTYCYQHNKSIHNMTFDTAKVFIDKLLTNNLNVPIDPNDYATLVYEFIGGEPFMEVKLMDQICDYTITKMMENHHPWLPCFRISICSNGFMYMTKEVQNFLQKYHTFLSFSVSIDGNKELHDKCRVDLQGNGTYDKAIEAVRHYRENYGEVPGTKMTVSPENIDYLYEAIINLINENFRDILVNCVFEKGWENSHAIILYNQLKKVADYFIENNLYDKIFMRFFSEVNYQPLNGTDDRNWCGGVITKDHMNFSIDYKGDLYPCIRYMASSLNNRQKPLKLGNVFSGYGITEEEKENIELLSNITRSSQSSDKCLSCPIASGCSWCSAYNYEEFGTPNKRATYICCMHQASALANAYFLNTLYRKLNMTQRMELYIPKDWALEIISEDEYNYLLKLSKEDDIQ